MKSPVKKTAIKKTAAKKSAGKKTARRKGVSSAQLREIVLTFPVTDAVSYGKQSFHVGKKFFTRLRDEDGSIVVIVESIDERDMLLESDAKLFHITDHYRDYPTVLVRIAEADAALLRAMLERRWRRIAPKRLVREFDAGSNEL